MDKKMLLVLTNAVEGREQEFNDWYTNQHLRDVLAVPGFTAAQRFEIQGEPVNGTRWNYCAIYEVEHDDPAEALRDLTSRAGTEAMPMSDALRESLCCALYAPLTERVTA